MGSTIEYVATLNIVLDNMLLGVCALISMLFFELDFSIVPRLGLHVTLFVLSFLINSLRVKYNHQH